MDKDDCETYRFVSKMLITRNRADELERAPCSRWWPLSRFATADCMEARKTIKELERKADWLEKCKKDPCACDYRGVVE